MAHPNKMNESEESMAKTLRISAGFLGILSLLFILTLRNAPAGMALPALTLFIFSKIPKPIGAFAVIGCATSTLALVLWVIFEAKIA
jgi:hypothetical protein